MNEAQERLRLWLALNTKSPHNITVDAHISGVMEKIDATVRAEIERLREALEDIKQEFIGVMRYPHGSVTCACCERMQAKASAALEEASDGDN